MEPKVKRDNGGRLADRWPLCCMTKRRPLLSPTSVFINRRRIPFLAAPCFPGAPDTRVESRRLFPAISCFLIFFVYFSFILLLLFFFFEIDFSLVLFFFFFLFLLSFFCFSSDPLPVPFPPNYCN